MMNCERQLADLIRQACLLEVRAEKPGNVSPGFAFEDASIADFETSAQVVAPILASSRDMSVGKAVLESVRQTRAAVGHNTNLGIVLLLAPLACVAPEQPLSQGIESVLSSLNVTDAIAVYQAIQLAAPAGLGTSDAQDVASVPELDLRTCMRLAAERDQIAAEYDNGFQIVLHDGQSLLLQTHDWNSVASPKRLAWVALHMMARFGDTLVLRKCGPAINRQLMDGAADVLESGWPRTTHGHVRYSDFDHFLRQDGHQRNPGTTADMIAAIVFAALRSGGWSCNAAETELIFQKVTDV